MYDLQARVVQLGFLPMFCSGIRVYYTPGNLYGNITADRSPQEC